jgi:hypothetical protein
LLVLGFEYFLVGPALVVWNGYVFGSVMMELVSFENKKFGTPEEVAARVVTAEVNRDGIFEVTLLKDPSQEKDPISNLLSYNLEYLSVGKRGNKVSRWKSERDEITADFRAHTHTIASW